MGHIDSAFGSAPQQGIGKFDGASFRLSEHLAQMLGKSGFGFTVRPEGKHAAIVYGEAEVLVNKVKIKDLSSGAEVSINSSDLLHNLRSLEESGGIAADE